MAHYVRFEIYIPVAYKVKEPDPIGHKLREVTHALDDQLIARFIKNTCDNYEGITQAHPLAPPLYAGWWKKKGKPLAIDHLTFLFGLVRIDQSLPARKFFETWKQRIEGEEHQDLILLVFYPVQTIGDFF